MSSEKALGCSSPKRSAPLSMVWRHVRHRARPVFATSMTCVMSSPGAPTFGA
jgi:hypothetical protein